MDRHKNQIDYIAINQRWKSSIKNCRAIPSEDCNPDHLLLLIATFKLKLTSKKTKTMIQSFDLEKLEGDLAIQYEAEVTNRIDALNSIEEEKTPEAVWIQAKEILTTTAETIIGRIKNKQNKPWITENTLNKIQENREAKTKKMQENTKH